MKTILSTVAILLVIHTGLNAQMIHHIGAGMSVNAVSINGLLESGHRVGPMAYVGAQVNARQSGYPALSFAPVIGAAGCWNNNKLHELTTMLYFKWEYAIASNDGFKESKPMPFGIGARHYLYNSWFDLSVAQRQVSFTMGWSFGNIYR